ncbi:MAG: methyltransferase domain-containing protein [Acidobacteria bacterium]|nr:methyltransferase domain-containing protein [Acidobacteriota bacterium]
MSCRGYQFADAAERHFTAEKVAKELERYRRKGVGSTTRLLRDGLAKSGLIYGTLLDIGGGVGALTFELLERGMAAAVVVEASSAYLDAAAAEAKRRGQASSVRFMPGDFVGIADSVSTASVVTLDRVVCCYPDYEPLLKQSLERADRALALSYPRDRWYVRAAMGLENALRSRKPAFRPFVHPVSRIRGIIESAGFELVSRDTTPIWSVDVYAKSVRSSPARASERLDPT